MKTHSCLLIYIVACFLQYAFCARSGESGSPSRNSGFKRPRTPDKALFDLNSSPPREEREHDRLSPTRSLSKPSSSSHQSGSHVPKRGRSQPTSPTGSLNKHSSPAHQSESHSIGKGKEQRKYSLTPSFSSSYSDSIKYYPTEGKIKTGEHGSQLRTPSPTSSQKRRQRSPTPDSGRKTKERSPTPESMRKHESGKTSPKDGLSPSKIHSLSKMHPLDPGISGTKKIVVNSPLVLSSSSQYTHGHSGRSSSTITPITAMLLEGDLAYIQKTGRSPPAYQSHSDTRSYDIFGGYASSPGSIQQQLLHDTASSRSPSPAGHQKSQASSGQIAPHSSHGGHTEAPAPASSAQSVHNSDSFSTQSHTVPRSSLRREGTTSPPEPSNSSSSREGSSPHPDAAIASPTHSGHSVGSIKSSKRSGSH